MMMRKQRGVSLIGLLIGAVIVIVVALVGIKITPAYLEYFAIKKAVTGIVADGEAKGTVNDVRRAFDRRASIDNIDIIKGDDLDVSKDGNDIVISFSYQKKVPLIGYVSLLFDFSGSSNPSASS